MPLDRDNDYGNYLYTCNRCRSCVVEPSASQLVICPAYAKSGFFAASGGGKGYVAQGILEGKVQLASEVAELAMNCLLCGACARACPPGFDTNSFIRDLRDHLAIAGFYANPAHERLIKNLRAKGSPYARAFPPAEFPAFTGEEEFLVLRGCRERMKNELTPALAVVMSAAGAKWGALTDEPCCGAPQLDLGDRLGFADSAGKMAAALAESGASRAVALCPHCAEALNGYALLDDLELEVEIISLPALLSELTGEGRLQPVVESPLTVTYHDPCRLSRALEEWETPREILEAMPGIEIKEMARSGEWGWCCGAGGWAGEIAPELRDFTARERMKEARETKAQAVVTACSYCTGTLSKAGGRKSSSGMQIIHLLSLLAGRLKS